ncbi:MAG: hypothetical protein QW334_00325 [Thermofilum sp.]
MNVRRFLNSEQNKRLDAIHEMVKDFYLGNDNIVTYSLAGFLENLTSREYVSPDYLWEKLNIIIEACRGSEE